VRATLSRCKVGDAAGPDGLRVGHFEAAAREEPDVAKVIAMFITRCLQQGPPAWLGTARLIGIPKASSPQPRPISIGMALRRIMMKALFRIVKQDILADLRSHPRVIQLFMGEPSAAEQAAILIDEYIQRARQGKAAVVGLDIKAAFDTLRRHAADAATEKMLKKYPRVALLLAALPRCLVFDGKRFAPKEGDDQGDTFSGVRFARALADALNKVADEFPTITFVCFADDITMLADSAATARKAFIRLLEELAKIGLKINRDKCWHVGADISDLGIPELVNTTKVLGIPLPLDHQAAKDAAASKVRGLAELVKLAKQIGKPAILRAFILSTLRPSVVTLLNVGLVGEEAAGVFDEATREAVAHALDDPRTAHQPHSSGRTPLLPPLAAEIAAAPVALASSLLTRGITRSSHRVLSSEAQTSFWAEVVPAAARRCGVTMSRGQVLRDGRVLPARSLRRALIAHNTPAEQPTQRTAGEAAQALLLPAAAVTWPLTEHAWAKLVRSAYGQPDFAPADVGHCTLCGGQAGPEHATTCTHSAVAAARTRRHNLLESFFIAVLHSCPTVIARTQPHVHKTPDAVPDGVARRSDLALTFPASTRLSLLIDLKVINEYAKEYERCGPDGAAAKKQEKAAKEYAKRTGRKDVRIWVFTAGGRLSPHASTDLAFLAKELDIAKALLVAGAYAQVLNGQAGVMEAYHAAVARKPIG